MNDEEQSAPTTVSRQRHMRLCLEDFQATIKGGLLLSIHECKVFAVSANAVRRRNLISAKVPTRMGQWPEMSGQRHHRDPGAYVAARRML